MEESAASTLPRASRLTDDPREEIENTIDQHNTLEAATITLRELVITSSKDWKGTTSNGIRRGSAMRQACLQREHGGREQVSAGGLQRQRRGLLQLQSGRRGTEVRGCKHEKHLEGLRNRRAQKATEAE